MKRVKKVNVAAKIEILKAGGIPQVRADELWRAPIGQARRDKHRAGAPMSPVLVRTDRRDGSVSRQPANGTHWAHALACIAEEEHGKRTLDACADIARRMLLLDERFATGTYLWHVEWMP